MISIQIIISRQTAQCTAHTQLLQYTLRQQVEHELVQLCQ